MVFCVGVGATTVIKRDAGTPLGFSYNLGPGSYVSFNLNSPKSQTVQRQPVSPNVLPPSPQPHPIINPNHHAPPSPIINQPNLHPPLSPTISAVPIFLNTPVHSNHPPPSSLPSLPLPMVRPISLNHYQLSPVPPNPLNTAAIPPFPTLSPAQFIPSRPDLLPPHLHPAHHPLPPTSPVPLPSYTEPPTKPDLQYDPFDFPKIQQDPIDSSTPPEAPPNSVPAVAVQQPISPPLFPVATFSPLPGPAPIFPQYDEQPPPIDFPEYEAVPVIPFSQLLPLRTHQLEKSSSDALFTSSIDNSLTAQRLKRKNLRKAKEIKSHVDDANRLSKTEMCGRTVNEDDLHLLREYFPQCSSQLGVCGLNHTDTSAVLLFGSCLNKKYPETVSLNLGRTLSSGHGSVSFHSDDDCTNFVNQFFPSCSQYLTTCSQVEEDREAAARILGCLFGQYSSLMVPLLDKDHKLTTDV